MWIKKGIKAHHFDKIIQHLALLYFNGFIRASFDLSDIQHMLYIIKCNHIQNVNTVAK